MHWHRSAIRSPRLAILGSLVVSAIGCTPRNQYVEPPPPEVTVTQPRKDSVTDYVEVTGVAHPVMSVDIRARVKGFLKERHFEEGSLVKEGQLLLTIDEEPFRVKLDQAKARLREADTALKKATQSQAREVARAQVELDESQLRLAQDEERRVRKLVSTRALTEEDLEKTTANLRKNEAQVNATKAQLRQADSDYRTNILAAEALLAAAQTAVRDAEIELSYCRIVSPIDGRIGRVLFDVGNLVGDGQASLLTTVVKLDPIYVYTNLNHDDFLKYRSAQSSDSRSEKEPVVMELGLSNDSGYPHRGHVDYHDPQVDRGTGTIQLRGVFANDKGAVLPGMFVRVRIPYNQRADVLLVPERALSIDQVGQYVYVIGKDDKVEYRAVRAGALLEGYRVVEGQLAASDRVVVEGLLRARPGMKVVPKPESAPAATPVASADSATTQRTRAR